MCILNCFIHVWLFVTVWTVACQTPLSIGISRQEYGVGCHFLFCGILLTQRSNPHLLHWQVDLYQLCYLGSLGYAIILRKNWKLTSLKLTLEPTSYLIGLRWLSFNFSPGEKKYTTQRKRNPNVKQNFQSGDKRTIQLNIDLFRVYGCFGGGVQSLSRVRLFPTTCTAACQASLSFTISWSLLKFMSIESVMPSNHLILCCPLFLPPSIFPSIRV